MPECIDTIKYKIKMCLFITFKGEILLYRNNALFYFKSYLLNFFFIYRLVFCCEEAGKEPAVHIHRFEFDPVYPRHLRPLHHAAKVHGEPVQAVSFGS